MSESQNRFGELPVFPSTWDAANLDFPPGRDFESEIEDLVLQGELEDSLDGAMSGKSSPRVWLLLHEPGQGRLSSVTALYFARELASRDQGVLVLDCDDDEFTLTRWAGREGSEGWADLARYGASVLTCGIPLPFAGRRGYLLGPGSYTPVDVQPGEIDQVVSRLRRQADDVLLVCPLDERGRMWAKTADIRILCWNTADTPGDRIEEIEADFGQASTPLTGLVRFGPAQELVPEVEPDPGADAGQEEASQEFVVVDRSGHEKSADGPPDLGQVFVDPFGESPSADTFARKRGTSRLFWWMALAVVGLIALAAWYYLEFVQAPSLDSPAGETSPVAEVGTGPGEEEVFLIPVSRDSVPAARPEPAALSGAETGSESGVETALELPAGSEADTTVEPESEEEQVALDEEFPGPAEIGGELEFYMDPYLVPVGSDGWALHIYSLPDQESTTIELEVLNKKGFMTAVREVQIKGKGRWYRIYLGSFPDRAVAQDAKAALLKELGEDWGRPTEF